MSSSSSDLSKFAEIALFPILDSLYEGAIKFATEYGTTLYDSSYLSFAYGTDSVLCTADEKFAKKIGSNDHLILLSSL